MTATSRIFTAEQRSPTWRRANGIAWVVLKDPEGNELCLGDVPLAD